MNYFLDANIILRYFAKDNNKLSPKAAEIIGAISERKIRAVVTTLVMHEVTYVLGSVYKVKRSEIVEKCKGLLSFTNLRVLDLEKQRVILALEDFEKSRVDFPDCVYKQVVMKNKLKMVSFDRDFDKLEIKRYEEI